MHYSADPKPGLEEVIVTGSLSDAAAAMKSMVGAAGGGLKWEFRSVHFGKEGPAQDKTVEAIPPLELFDSTALGPWAPLP